MVARLRWLAFLLLKILLVGFSGYVLLLGLVVASCRAVEMPLVLPSPDRRVSLLVVNGTQGPTVPGYAAFYLVGKDVGAPLQLGQYGHFSWYLSYGWLDNVTLNICPLAEDPKALSQAEIVTEAGTRQAYRITHLCEAGMLDAYAPGAPIHGYDFRGPVPPGGH